MITIFTIIILIFSVIIHEVSHGYMADFLGDQTPRMQGRLTLNPLKHIDPVGSILVPLVTYLIGGFTFGWARPVIYNPHNLKNKRSGEFLIAIAGPASNLIIALIFGTLIRFTALANIFPNSVIEISTYIVLINIALAIFNLIPLPPLDGSKLLFAFFPDQYGRIRYILETYSSIFVLIVVFLLWQIIYPVIPFIFRLFTGFYL